MAGALVTAAEIKLAQRDHAGARAAADEAAGWYRKQGREGWVAVTTSLALQAAAREDDPAIELADQLDEVAVRLDDGGLGAEATRSRLVAALVRAEAAETMSDDPVPADTRRRVRSGPSADRILLAHVDAVAAQKRGDRAAARRAISRGLSVAMSSQASLGSLETRAHAAIHGNALDGDRRTHRRLRRTTTGTAGPHRGDTLMAARTPSLRPPADPEIARLLAELRSTEVTLADPSVSDAERRVCRRPPTPVSSGTFGAGRGRHGVMPSARIAVRREIESASALSGDRQLLAHARLDGRLYAVSVIGGRAALHDLGSLDDVNERIEAVTFCLHRLNRTQGSDDSRVAAAEMLYAFADELAEIVLPPVVAESFDPVVIVPTAVIHDVPWGLLPPLAGRAVSINASVSAWGHAERTLRQRRGTLLDGIEAGFVAGPGLDFADVEVKHLAGGYDDPGRAAG